jgi:hypothetical protein
MDELLRSLALAKAEAFYWQLEVFRLTMPAVLDDDEYLSRLGEMEDQFTKLMEAVEQ